ncbi:MAG: hypothetical protein ACPG4T_22815, partial [Nannocystaceae bacterium]
PFNLDSKNPSARYHGLTGLYHFDTLHLHFEAVRGRSLAATGRNQTGPEATAAQLLAIACPPGPPQPLACSVLLQWAG